MIDTLIQHEIQTIRCRYENGLHVVLSETAEDMTLENRRRRGSTVLEKSLVKKAGGGG